MVAVVSSSLLGRCCHFLRPFGWLLLFPRDFWMVAVIFQEPYGYLRLFLGGFWMIVVIS